MPKQRSGDDLSEVKALIGDAQPGAFSLEDILAEYGCGRPRKQAPPEEPEEPEPEKPEPEAVLEEAPEEALEEPPEKPEPEEAPEEASEEPAPPEPPRREPERPDNVVAFPGRAAPDPEEEPEEEPKDGPDGDGPEAGRVVPFPEEESLLSAFLKDVTRKAGRYADHMFQEPENEEELRRLERLIPGTDEEDPEPPRAAHFFRRPKKAEPPPPDTPPQELAAQYGKGLSGLRLRSLLVFLLAAAAVAQLLLPAALLSPLDQYAAQAGIAAALLAAGVLLSWDVLWEGVVRAFRGRVGMDTLTALSAAFTLADAAALAAAQNREGELPCAAAVLAGLFFLLHGTYHKKCALRLSCRTAASAAEPYLLTLDEGKWSGRDTYCKWSGPPDGFGSQIQTDDGAQRIYRRACPVLLLACALFSLLASVGLERPDRLLWCLSVSFTAAASFSGALAYGRAFHKVARRLARTGAALAGWPGMARSKLGSRLIVTDGDLFPPGCVEFNGIKIFGDWPAEKVIGNTATLIRDSGSGLTKLFHNLLRAQGAVFRRAERLTACEGGLSAVIRGEQVLVGTSDFMKLMEVALPQGLRVKNAVFCAIDGELAGIFALNYSLPEAVFPALDALLREKVGPVLATRDFNIIPAMLHQRFSLAADRMDFPPAERRRELSDPDQPHSSVLTAVLCREGLLPCAEAVVGAKRLRWTARFGAALACVGGALGILLTCYLASVDAYGSLSPLNLLFFQLFWLAPVWFLTSWSASY